MEDCYQILGVRSSASAAEIKRAFRLKAKAIHPDIPVNATQNPDSVARMQELISAYQTLSAPGRRAEFDATYAAFRKYREGTSTIQRFDYRLWLMERKDPESRAKLIFFDLLHDLEEEAVREYLQQLEKNPTFNLARYFDREDFMDCGFILAEELGFRSHYLESFVLLGEVVLLEQKKPYFKHFFPEVIILIRDTIRNRLVGKIQDELALDALETALELRLGKKEDAWILKLMAVCYERIGDLYTARLCLLEALRLDSKLTGIRDLKKTLGVME